MKHLLVGIALLALASACSDDHDKTTEDLSVPAGDLASHAMDLAANDLTTIDLAMIDLGPQTPCPDNSGQFCNRDTEVCVITSSHGPKTVPACKPLPTACANDRGCGCVGSALCNTASNLCSEQTEDNTVYCSCPTC